MFWIHNENRNPNQKVMNKISVETIVRWILSTVSTLLLGFMTWFVRETYVEMKAIKELVVKEQLQRNTNTEDISRLQEDVKELHTWQIQVERRLPKN